MERSGAEKILSGRWSGGEAAGGHHHWAAVGSRQLPVVGQELVGMSCAGPRAGVVWVCKKVDQRSGGKGGWRRADD